MNEGAYYVGVLAVLIIGVLLCIAAAFPPRRRR